MPSKGGAEDILREKARIRMPNIAVEQSEYLVAVASHLKTPETCLPADFTWIKCRARHPITKIRHVYAQKMQATVDMYLGSTKLPLTTAVPTLDKWEDRFIVLQAVLPGLEHPAGPAVPVTREPLRPVNASFAPPKLVDEPLKIAKPILTPTGSRPPTASSRAQYPGPAQPFSPSQYAPGESEVRVKHEDTFKQPCSTSLGYNSSYPVIPQEIPTFGSSPVKEEERLGLGDESLASPTPQIQPPAGSHFPTMPIQDVAPPTSPITIPNAAQNERLKGILADGSPEILEAEVQRSTLLLGMFEHSLMQAAAQSSEALQWLQQIETVQQRNVNEPTIIGVVGNTGAGKSSVINAMLDEERLVPTNCMRACTAVVTELSWNSSNDENAKYRAEIEFIKPEDWAKELRILFEELLDGSGKVSRDATNEDSEAGVAYAKIKAVYPRLTREEIASASVGELMRHPSVQGVLGTTKTVEQARSDRFYRVLQSYVDSKEKATTGDKKQPKEMEYWPLIKVVKIYTKADALSTGAMVVDLPGVHDSNAARSAIAQNYMKMCTGLWIVAPITRAVDDKAAKSLLGESFKRQLKYDGIYSRVTFICSKTDDISITEASDSLGLEEEMSSKWGKADQIDKDRQRITNELAALKDSRGVYGEVLSNTDDELEVWDKLLEDMEDGKTIYAPSGKSTKRKRSVDSGRSQRKRAKHDSSFESSSEDGVSDKSDAESDSAPQSEPLTAEAIQGKITDLKLKRKEARLQRRQLDNRINELKDELKALDASYAVIEAEMSAICIAGRNQYSKGAIQQDFAAGIKELDQETMAEQDEENFNPDEDIRDYEEVARSLPVFCVSSRAYQKLSGRLQRDKDVPGFKSVEETEIPQLQAHCKKLTEAGRAATCRRFLNAYSQLVNSLALWASNDGTGIILSDDQMAAEGNFLQSTLSQLELGLEKSVQGCLTEMKESLAETIYDRFDQVIEAAVNEANATAAKWGAPVNRVNRAAGGYFWATYKAICRRAGVYSNNWGTHDFNAQLTEPIMKQLGGDWEKAFARRLPNVLQSFQRSTKTLLQSFHGEIEARALKTGSGLSGLAILGQQLQNYEAIFKDLTAQMVQIINERQRDANREFTPVIAKHLASAYQYCTDVSGPGSYMKMKQHMTQHVDEHRKNMFRESTQEVKSHLKKMCCQIEEEMSNKAEEVFILMRRDYMTVITGAHVPEGTSLPKVERLARSEIVRIAQEVERLAENGKGYWKVNEGVGGNEGVKEEYEDKLMVDADAEQDSNKYAMSDDEKAAERREGEVKPEPMEE